MEVNKKYFIKLTAITPLAVGAGNEEEWVKSADYVIKDNRVYIFDLQKVAKAGIDLSQLSLLFVNNDHNGVVNLLGNKLASVSARVFDLPCTTDNNIKAFERSKLHDLPLVAGSSLKGAIRSVLFNHLRDFERDNESVFGKMKDGSDFMRFIKVGDIEMHQTQLFNSKIFNLRKIEGSWLGGWKHALDNGTNEHFRPTGFNTLYECVAPRETGYSTIVFSPQLFKNVLDKMPRMAHADRKSALMNGGIKTLFAIINSFTKRYLSKELEFFNKYSANRSDEIVDNIKHLLSLIPEDNSSCLIKMSAGVGFHAITGDWQYEDYSRTGIHETGRHQGKQKYKSRKIVETTEGLSLMGFVMLSEASETEHLSHMTAIETNFKSHIQSILIQKAEAAAQAEADNRVKEEKEAKYAQLIKEAEDAEQAKDYITAVAKAEEAGILFSSRKEHSIIISRNKPKANQQKLEKEAEEAKKRANNTQIKPLAEDIFYARIPNPKTFMGRCKSRRNEVNTPEGLAIVAKWIEDFYANAPAREKKNYKDAQRWKELPIDQSIIEEWIQKYKK